MVIFVQTFDISVAGATNVATGSAQTPNICNGLLKKISVNFVVSGSIGSGSTIVNFLTPYGPGDGATLETIGSYTGSTDIVFHPRGSVFNSVRGDNVWTEIPLNGNVIGVVSWAGGVHSPLCKCHVYYEQ